MSGQDIINQRKEINRIDGQILELLGRRALLALEIGEWKKEQGRPIYDPNRERDIISALCKANPSILPESSLRRIFLEIISACRAAQDPLTVSFLGPAATFCHMAAISYFGHSCTFSPRASIADLFREVEHGRAHFGVAPAENSNEGAVSSTLDELARSELKITGEILLPVSHALLTGEVELDQIKRVYSHPQALAQCRAWLSRNVPRAELLESSSTAAAAAQAVEEKGSAAIGGALLADRHGLNLLAENIQDRPLNLTRFFVLGRDENESTGRDKTSVMFITSHEPGSLHQALSPMADAEINMTRIESRPTRDKPWNYAFFVDFEGHRSEDRIQKALAGLAANVDKLKVLGSYPAADAVDQIVKPGPNPLADPAPAQSENRLGR